MHPRTPRTRVTLTNRAGDEAKVVQLVLPPCPSSVPAARPSFVEPTARASRRLGARDEIDDDRWELLERGAQGSVGEIWHSRQEDLEQRAAVRAVVHFDFSAELANQAVGDEERHTGPPAA